MTVIVDRIKETRAGKIYFLASHPHNKHIAGKALSEQEISQYETVSLKDFNKPKDLKELKDTNVSNKSTGVKPKKLKEEENKEDK